MGNIIVYGSGWAGIAAAAKAARFAPNAEIHLISPYPVAKLGGISTIGGQNYIDLRKYNDTPVQGGSFEDWYGTLEEKQYYNTDDMADDFADYLGQYSNITVHHMCDIKNVTTASSPYRITGVTIQGVVRNSTGYVVWSGSSSPLNCDVIIDASDEGRIARTVNSAVTVGRYDWPAVLLESTEKSGGLARQQAATLMFKMKNIQRATSDMAFTDDGNMCWGGSGTFCDNNSSMNTFNRLYKNQGYMLKPINAARNGSANEWWINGFMIFNVDGRRNQRDIGTSMYPTNAMSGVKDTDQAYVSARSFLNTHKGEILSALREIPAFANASFVEDENGIVTGETLYIRETVHMTQYVGDIANGTEDTNYNLTTTACHYAGAAYPYGNDTDNYSTRIGLGYYNSDLHPYVPEDCIDDNGNFVWGYNSYANMRTDLYFSGSDPEYPVYVPYSVLKTEYVANLLIPGYAANMSSFAWGEMRVFPNQAVLGDAAGVAAAYCYNNSKYPYNLVASDITKIQRSLVTAGAIINKPSTSSST